MYSVCITETIQRGTRVLQQQVIITPLDIGKTAEMLSSFILVPKDNGKIRLCLDPAKSNQAFICLVHRGLTVNDIFPKLTNAQYLNLIDMSYRYHNLELDEKIIIFNYILMPVWHLWI